jgi:hypothetical protein
MDDSELFDVFSVDNNPEPVQKTAPGPQKKAKKAKHTKQEKKATEDTVNGKRSHDDTSSNSAEPEENGTHVVPVSKRHRKNTQNPIIVDSFETESDQIVPAAQGLQGTAVADHNIIIKKKVFLLLLIYCSIDMPLYFQPRIGNLPRWNLISSRTRQHECTLSS